MKKLLSPILIGLLGLLIHSTSIAEDVEETSATETTATETADESPVEDSAQSMAESPVESSAESASESSSENIAVAETEPVKPMPEILGEPVELLSVRGDNDVDSVSALFPNRRTMAVDGGIEVSFEEQPPMIPHSIDKTRISLQENSCLKCHSRVDSKLEDAPKPPKSHFIKRDGSRTKKVSTGRYFCTQCHVPQANKKPLVNNTYKN